MRLGIAACVLALAACAWARPAALAPLPEEERARFWRCEPFAWDACARDEECRSDPGARRRSAEILARLYAQAADEAARRELLEEAGCPPDVLQGRSPIR